MNRIYTAQRTMISAVAGTSRSRSGTLSNVDNSFQDENRRRSLAQTEVHRVNRGGDETFNKQDLSNNEIQLELVGRTQESKNWGGMIISVIVIILICSAIITVAIIVSENQGYYLINEYPFEAIFNKSQQEKHYQFQWLNDSVYASRDAHNNVILTDLQQNSTVILMENRTWNVQDVSEFTISPTGDYILLVCQKETFYRHSYTAVYMVYDIERKSVLPALQPSGMTNENPRLRYASWSPDSNQPSLVFVYDNDIYYQKGVTGTPRQITTSGQENLIYNGIPDYALEGDLIESNNAIYWLKNSGRFVYATFNDTGIDQAFITKYDYLANPLIEYFPYPKPGGLLPTVTLHMVDLETSEKTELIPPPELANQEHFYKYVVWINRFQVAVTWLNRQQDHAVVYICDTDTGICNTSVEDTTDSGWVETRGPPIFSEDGDSYALIWPLWDEDGNDRHYHVHVVTIQSDGPDVIENLTEGAYEVTKIVAYRKLQKQVYFLANKNASWDSHLYRVTFDRRATVECLSCKVRPGSCTFYEAEAVEDTSKYVLHCRGPGIPKSTLHDFDLDPLDYQLLENNTALYENAYSRVHLEQQSQWFEVGDVKIPVRILYHSRKDENRHHPLLINLMDNPGSSMVRSEFYQGWFTYLASRYYVITANIDYRGTSGIGENHLHANNDRLGTVEVKDIIAVTEYLRNSSLGIVSFDKTQFDQTKVAIMGSAYGGFLASMAYAKSDYFNCSIAISPVTDWRHYDAVSTEKFMSRPTDNMQGYENTNVSDVVMKGEIEHYNNSLMIVHGMADKSVHFQHSANLVKALASKDIAYETLFYPDEGHDLWSSKVKTNLYESMTNYLVRCLDLQEAET